MQGKKQRGGIRGLRMLFGILAAGSLIVSVTAADFDDDPTTSEATEEETSGETPGTQTPTDDEQGEGPDAIGEEPAGEPAEEEGQSPETPPGEEEVTSEPTLTPTPTETPPSQDPSDDPTEEEPTPLDEEEDAPPPAGPDPNADDGNEDETSALLEENPASGQESQSQSRSRDQDNGGNSGPDEQDGDDYQDNGNYDEPNGDPCPPHPDRGYQAASGYGGGHDQCPPPKVFKATPSAYAKCIDPDKRKWVAGASLTNEQRSTQGLRINDGAIPQLSPTRLQPGETADGTSGALMGDSFTVSFSWRWQDSNKGDSFEKTLHRPRNCKPPEMGKVTITKDSIPTTDVAFEFTDDLGQFQLGDDQSITRDVPVGSYTVTETVPEGWLVIGIVCSTGGPFFGNSATFDVGSGEHIECTFFNQLDVQSHFNIVCGEGEYEGLEVLTGQAPPLSVVLISINDGPEQEVWGPTEDINVFVPLPEGSGGASVLVRVFEGLSSEIFGPFVAPDDCGPPVIECTGIEITPTEGFAPLDVTATVSSVVENTELLGFEFVVDGEALPLQGSPTLNTTLFDPGLETISASVVTVDGSATSPECAGKVNVKQSTFACDSLDVTPSEGETPLTVNVVVNGEAVGTDITGYALVVNGDRSATQTSKAFELTLEEGTYLLEGIVVTPLGEASGCTALVTVRPDTVVTLGCGLGVLGTNDPSTFTYVVDIEAVGTDVDSAILAFGDGNTQEVADGDQVPHTYDAPGAYEATLTVTGGDGLTATCSVDVLVPEPPPPAAPGIDIVKTVDRPIVDRGGDVVFMIKVTNTGNVPLKTSVEDLLVETCRRPDLGVLQPGQSVSYNCGLWNIQQSLNNIADATGVTPGGDRVDAWDNAVVDVRDLPPAPDCTPSHPDYDPVTGRCEKDPSEIKTGNVLPLGGPHNGSPFGLASIVSLVLAAMFFFGAVFPYRRLAFARTRS